jgi:heme/copper-type cytochrome/quinol oxidase subunit 2
MAGGAIVLLTLIVIGLFVLMVWLSSRTFQALDEYLNNPGRGLVAKLLLAIPFLIVGIWCFLLDIILTIVTLGAAAGAVTSARDWWHKGK